MTRPKELIKGILVESKTEASSEPEKTKKSKRKEAKSIKARF